MKVELTKKRNQKNESSLNCEGEKKVFYSLKINKGIEIAIKRSFKTFSKA